MTKKQWLVLGVVALAVTVVCGSLVLWSFVAPLKPGVTAENFRRLHQGMTQQEVEAILGSGTIIGDLTIGGGQRISTELFWQGEEGAIQIHFQPAARFGQFAGEDGMRIKLRANPETWKEKLSRWVLP